MINLEMELSSRQALIEEKRSKLAKAQELRIEADKLETSVADIDVEKLEREIVSIEKKVAELEHMFDEPVLEKVKGIQVEEPAPIEEAVQAVDEKFEVEVPVQVETKEEAVFDVLTEDEKLEALKKYFADKYMKDTAASKAAQEEVKEKSSVKEESPAMCLKNLFKKHEAKKEVEAEVAVPEVIVIKGSEAKVDAVDPVEGSLHGKAAIDPMFLDRDELL